MKAVRFSIKCGVVNEHAMLKCEFSHAMMLIHHVRQRTPCLTIGSMLGMFLSHLPYHDFNINGLAMNVFPCTYARR